LLPAQAALASNQALQVLLFIMAAVAVQPDKVDLAQEPVAV
jgi:hypothetical protein